MPLSPNTDDFGTPLTDDELMRLEELLEAAGDKGMPLSMLDGFFCALVIGPSVVTPSEYLPYVFGEGYDFASRDEAAEMLDLLVKHWNSIAQTMMSRDFYDPLIDENEDGTEAGNIWACGFMLGVTLRETGWQPLMEHKKKSDYLVPMMVLAYEYAETPLTSTEELNGEARTTFIASIPGCLRLIYEYFFKQRTGEDNRESSTTIRREPKQGRNDPCACGSGKKFKHCCINGAA